MATIELDWLKNESPIRLDEYAYDVGFDLNKLEQKDLPYIHKQWIYNKIIGSILYYVSSVWEGEWDKLLTNVKQGVYVITLANKLSIDYDGFPSPVLYIGRGQIYNRIRSHLWSWIRHFSDSLQGLSFYFWMTEVKIKGSYEAYKDVESDLLYDFYEKFSHYPIQNSIFGKTPNKTHVYKSGWNKPLWNPPYIKSGWSIKPLQNNPWAFSTFNGVY